MKCQMLNGETLSRVIVWSLFLAFLGASVSTGSIGIAMIAWWLPCTRTSRRKSRLSTLDNGGKFNGNN